MAGHAERYLKWMEMDRNGWKLMEMVGIGWKLLEWLEMAEMA